VIDPAGLRARATVVRALRSWFDLRGYVEVTTPTLVPSPAMEATLYAVSAGDGWLRTSPEFALKRVVAAGLPRIYEIGPCFRARERGAWHGTEFTMLEWYRAGADLTDLMDEVEDLVAHAASAVGASIPEWRRDTVRAVFQEATGLDLALASASELSPADASWDDAFFRRWVNDVEPTLTGARFVTEWPASQAALAQVRTDGDWPIARRFEVFLGGLELANAFQELLDPTEQLRRFAASATERAAAGEEPHPVDRLFVDAVGRMPKTAGIALGVDRLVAALCGWDGIGRGRVDR